MSVKIFLSWSGERSRRVTKVLRQLLEDVNHHFQPWMSETDIKAGARWGTDLAKELEETNFGVVCVTLESLRSPWLLFEAGALSKSVKESLICPYLVDLKQEEVDGPLSQFQGKDISKEGTWELVRDIDESAGEASLGESRLRRYFERSWPEFEAALAELESVEEILPNELRYELAQSLANLFPLQDEARMQVAFTGVVPMELVNWAQPAMSFWTEIIDLALERGEVRKLLEGIAEGSQYPRVRELLELLPDGE